MSMRGIAQVVSHIKHIAKVAGTECIGLGSDFDGITTNEELMDASYLPRLEDALFAAGFSQNQVEGIFYKNVLRSAIFFSISSVKLRTFPHIERAFE